jgi:hypothetical protein
MSRVTHASYTAYESAPRSTIATTVVDFLFWEICRSDMRSVIECIWLQVEPFAIFEEIRHGRCESNVIIRPIGVICNEVGDGEESLHHFTCPYFLDLKLYFQLHPQKLFTYGTIIMFPTGKVLGAGPGGIARRQAQSNYRIVEKWSYL